MFFKHTPSLVEPAFSHLAVAVDKLDEANLRGGLAESFGSLIPARPRKDETLQVRRRRLPATGRFRRCRRPTRIHVDACQILLRERGQAATEPLTLVAADGDDTESTRTKASFLGITLS